VKFPLAFQIIKLPSSLAAAISFPSGLLQQQLVTLVFPPLSLDFTTITDFDDRRFVLSQIRRVESEDAVRNREGFVGCQEREEIEEM